MARLQTLKPRTAQLAPTLRVLDTKAGATPRVRGRTWTTTRQRIAARDGGVCADCGGMWRSDRDHIDHQVPLEQGGSNDDSNLRLRCVECHQKKTDAETAARFGKG